MRQWNNPLLPLIALAALLAPPALGSWQGAEAGVGTQAQPEDASPSHDPAAVEVLREVTERVAGGYVAIVRTYAAGSDSLAGIFPKAEGRWSQRALDPDAEEPTWAVRFTGQGTVMGRPEPVDFDVLWEPERTSWVDHASETFFVQRPDMLRRAGQSYQVASSAFNQARELATGFAETLESAAEIQHLGTADVEGETCDVVSIRAEPGRDASLWYFSTEDRLPRRTEIVLPENEMLSGSLRVDFTDGVPGATETDDFRIFAPDGYREDIARAIGQPSQLERRDQRLPAAQPEPVVEGQWSISDTEGATLTAADLRGRVSVLYFWGTWSPACAKATPALAALAEGFDGQAVDFYGLAFREGEPDRVAEAAGEQGHPWRVFPEADEAVASMNIRNAPSVIVLGPEGALLLRSGRPRNGDYQAWAEQVRSVVARAVEGADDQSRGAAAVGEGSNAQPGSVRRVPPPRIRSGDE